MAESEDIGSVGAIVDTDPTPTYDSSSSTPGSPAMNLAQRSAREPSAQEIQHAVQQVNDRLSSVNRVLQLNVDSGTGLTVATIKNSQTGEVLGQFPSTGSIELAKMLAEWSSGKNILLDLIA
jgi:uncharacterized FlaG/YvyC family protein